MSPPFVAGAIHGADPSCGADSPEECAARWREMVPDMPEMVARWIAHPSGFQAVVYVYIAIYDFFTTVREGVVN